MIKILIIHQNFPGQFLRIIDGLSKRPDIEILGIGRNTAPGHSKIRWIRYKPHRPPRADCHPYLRQMEEAVLHGQAVAKVLNSLKSEKYYPDIIISHPGWGETLYAKEIFPASKLIHLCEWYYSTEGADFNFDPEFPSSLNEKLKVTTWNALHLLNLELCDIAISPTQWQKSRFPIAYHKKIHVIHEGIHIPSLDIKENKTIGVTTKSGKNQPFHLKSGDPIITYVSRNLEPYRGFHIFMRSLVNVLRERPNAKIMVVGGDGTSYGPPPNDAPNWRTKMLKEIDRKVDISNIIFCGKIPYDKFQTILQLSSAHVYLTYPFVLSWSLLEAMAMRCRIFASDTAPVREVIKNGVNGNTFNFFDHLELSTQLIKALDTPDADKELRNEARISAENYSVERGVSAYEEIFELPSLKNKPFIYLHHG